MGNHSLSVVLLLITSLVLPTWADITKCSGLPYTSNICSGTGYLAPLYQGVYFNSGVVNPTLTLRINAQTCGTDGNYYQRTVLMVGQDSNTTTTTTFVTGASNAEQTWTQNMPTSDTTFQWAVYRECWYNYGRKRDVSPRDGLIGGLLGGLFGGGSSSNSGSSGSSGSSGTTVTSLPAPGDDGWYLTRQCYVPDQTNDDRTDANRCSMTFTYCKRQADTVLQNPADSTVYQLADITFSWSNAYPSLPECVTKATSFVYQFSVWNTSSTLTEPVLTRSLPVNLTQPSTTLSAGTLPAGSYWWSVRTIRASGTANVVNGGSANTTTQYATTRQFKYCGSNTAPSAVNLLAPISSVVVSSADVTVIAGNPTIPVTFSWSPANFGITCYGSSPLYVLQYATSSSFSPMFAKELDDSGQTTVSVPMRQGTWYWKILSSNRVLGTNSTAEIFSVCFSYPPAAFSTVSPAANAQGVDYSSITFSWGASSRQSTCFSNNTIVYTLNFGPTASTMVANYTGTGTTVTFTPFDKGTWYWSVTATDGRGASTTTPISSFVTVDSICANVPPTAGSINLPTYSYVASAISATLSWTIADLGVSCDTPFTPGFSLVITDPNLSATTIPLVISATSYTSSPSVVGDYTWKLTVKNAHGDTTDYPMGSFTICDLTGLQNFAGSFAPPTGTLDASKSLTNLTWAYLAPQIICLGGSVTYKLKISGSSASISVISFADHTTPFYDISKLTAGTWSWELQNDVSTIPILGLTPRPSPYTGSFKVCFPDDPSTPTLAGPSRFTQINGESATVQWTDPHNIVDSCTPFLAANVFETYSYDLFLSRTSSFSPTPDYTTSAARTGLTSFSYTAHNLTAGSQYWKVQVTKKLTINGNVKFTKSQNTLSSVFTICISTAPAEPVLSFPANATVFQRCNITTSLAWVPLLNTDFGADCSVSPVKGLRRYLGLDPDNLTDVEELLSFQSSTDPFSLINDEKFLPNTWYYWRVEAYNSLYNATSEIFSFKTPNTALTACSGHGDCNSGGTCDCHTGYTGTTCASVLPTRAPGDTGENQAPPDVGGIVGGVAGGLFLILLLAFAAFFVLRRKAKRQLEKPVRPPPDFPPLAFTVPPGFPPLATEKIVPWYSFEQLLVVYGFALPFAILDATQATEIDDVVKCLVYVIESHGQGANFVKALVSKDLKEKKDTNNLSSATLFRDNSHASKAFKNYAKIVALPYLFYIFGDAVYELCSNEAFGEPAPAEGKKDSRRLSGKKKKSGDIELQQVVVRLNSSGQNSLLDSGSFEVDPNKMSVDDDVLSNAIFLQLKCQKLLVKVFRSSEIFPQAFVDIFVHLLNEVQESLTREDGYNAIAAFIFLRLVNPSILFPNQYGLIEAPPNNEGLTRQLILITKVLQNLANGVHFGNKEQHMSPMNDFIDSNKDPLRNFLNDVVSKAPSDAEDPSQHKSAAFNILDKVVAPKRSLDDDDFFKPLEVPRPIVETSLTVTYNQFCRNKDKVLENLKKYRSEDDVKIITNKSNAIMDAIGEPIARNIPAPTDKRGKE